MSQNITFLGNNYSNVPAVNLPKTGGGTAKFTDISSTTAVEEDVTNGKIFFKADGTQGTGTNSGGTVNLQEKTNITPTTSSQTITPDSGYVGLSSVQINAMPGGTAGTPTATKGTVSNHSVTVTPSVTNATGYITGGTKTGTAITVSAAELVSGSETKTENGIYDVTNLASLVVNVPTGGGSAAIYLPPSAELVASASNTINLSTGTDWDSWTPSTSNHVLLAAGAARAECNYTISGSTDCQNISAIGVAAYVTHYDYGTATMAKGYQASRIVYCIAYYAPVSVPEYSDNNYGMYGVLPTSRQIYYTSATAKSTYANSSYGIGPSAATWAVSSATSDSSRAIGFTRPAMNARCNATYFSTTAAGKIVSADSYIQCEYRIWTMPKDENPLYALFDYTNGALW